MPKLTFENAEAWQVQPSQLEEHWWKLAPFIQRWIDKLDGEFELEDIYSLCYRGLMSLIVVHTAGDIKLVSITEFIQYPRKKVLRIVGIAGEKPIIAVKFWKSLEIWAKANGATAIETFATPETVKLDMRLGMQPLYTLMRKTLKDEV